MPGLRFAISITAVTASLVAALVVTFGPVSEPGAPFGAAVVPAAARLIPEPVARGASHDESVPEASPEPAPGDPWPAARQEEWRHVRLHTQQQVRQHRSQVAARRRLADEAFRIVRGDRGTSPDVWSNWDMGGRPTRDHERRPVRLEVLTVIAPESPFAASFADYAAIRGGGYFSGQRSGARGDARYDPDREIPGYTAWIEKYPGHPGVDDACYRLGRCFGIRGDGRQAMYWFRRAQDAPDGDMKRDARVWELLWLDMLLPMDELRAEAAGGDPEAVWTLGIRLVRRGEYAEGVRWMRAALPRLEGRSAGRAQGSLSKVLGLVKAIRKGDFYGIGRYQYHSRGLYENVIWPYRRSGDLLAEDVLWVWGHASAPEAFVAEYRLANRHWQARRTFLRIVEARPGGKLEAKARYSATTALGHTQGWYHEQRVVSCPEEDRVRLAREYLAIARDFPESTLADDALYYSGLFSGDPEAFAEVLSRYPNGDMVRRAERGRERALRNPPATVEQLSKYVDAMSVADPDSWQTYRALHELERRLGFCTACIERLPDAAREREIGRLVDWFRSVESSLVFDRTAGIYVVR